MFTTPRNAAVLAVALIGVGAAVAAPAPAVVGGTQAQASAYPWLAAIGTQPFLARPGGQFCAGALIAPDRVLTAGHCGVVAQTAPPAMTVTFGRTDLRG